MNGHDGNVAFKCTYNDGGDRGFVGFGGTCSNGNIWRNVKTKKTKRLWCSHPDNACQRFCVNEFRGRRARHPCNESRIIDRWRFGPGTYTAEDRAGEPIPMNHARKGKVALLTTRHPERDTEPERIVFGVYEIVEVSEVPCVARRTSGLHGAAPRMPCGVQHSAAREGLLQAPRRIGVGDPAVAVSHGARRQDIAVLSATSLDEVPAAGPEH